MERLDPADEYSVDKQRSAVRKKTEAIRDNNVSNKDELSYYDPDIHIPLNGYIY